MLLFREYLEVKVGRARVRPSFLQAIVGLAHRSDCLPPNLKRLAATHHTACASCARPFHLGCGDSTGIEYAGHFSLTVWPLACPQRAWAARTPRRFPKVPRQEPARKRRRQTADSAAQLPAHCIVQGFSSGVRRDVGPSPRVSHDDEGRTRDAIGDGKLRRREFT